MSFARNIGNKYGKKIFDKSLRAGKDFAKIAGKKVLTKCAEATGDLIGNKDNEDKVKYYLNLLLENMLELIVYSIHITKINQLDLKHLC